MLTASQTTTQLPAVPVASLKPSLRQIGGAFRVGGLLWIAHYLLQLVAGGIEGEAAMESRFSFLDGICFSFAIVALCCGLVLLGNRLRPRATALSVIGLTFAIIATCGICFGFGRYLINHQPSGVLGGIGVIGSCLSAVFVALAARQAYLPPRLWKLLLQIGLLTFPLILAFILPGQFVPAYLTDELPFALSGIAYLAFGRKLQKFNNEMI